MTPDGAAIPRAAAYSLGEMRVTATAARII